MTYLSVTVEYPSMQRIEAGSHLGLSLNSLIAHGQWTRAHALSSYRTFLVASPSFGVARRIHCGVLRALKGLSIAPVRAEIQL